VTVPVIVPAPVPCAVDEDGRMETALATMHASVNGAMSRAAVHLRL
jgi:hypothetical protein